MPNTPPPPPNTSRFLTFNGHVSLTIVFNPFQPGSSLKAFFAGLFVALFRPPGCGHLHFGCSYWLASVKATIYLSICLSSSFWIVHSFSSGDIVPWTIVFSSAPFIEEFLSVIFIFTIHCNNSKSLPHFILLCRRSRLCQHFLSFCLLFLESPLWCVRPLLLFSSPWGPTL
jgi:hypothetical protein